MSLIVGLTGQTGAGKTTACDVFSKHGFGVINCDLISREVVNDNSECLKELVCEFSKSILNDDHTLNRRRLGEVAFSNPQKLRRLNEITHPYILKRIKAVIDSMSKEYDIIIVDAPTLFESGADRMCQKIVSIVASDDVIVPRIMSRDMLDEKSAKNRLNSQHTPDFFERNSDFTLHNNGSKEEFLDSLYYISKKLKEYTNGNSC